jgi:hypothetical protein
MSAYESWSLVFSAAQAVSVLVALISLLSAVWIYRRDTMWRLTDEVRKAYLAHLNLCLAHPNLDIHDAPLPSPPPMSADDERKEDIVFAQLIMLLRLAYFVTSHPDPAANIRSAEWETFIVKYACRPNFRKVWQKRRDDHGKEFRDFIERIMARCNRKDLPPAPVSAPVSA